MQEARERLEAALQDDLPVLIEGESGTGKELVARYLHLRSDRAVGPFVRVNCGAIPARLMEPEALMKGWSGDPQADATRGTVFLDGIAEMDFALRQRMIPALKPGKPGEPGRRFDARIVCASSVVADRERVRERAGGRDMSAWASDFKHRVRLLPLRERKADLPALCGYLLENCARNFGRPIPQLSAAVLEEFERRKWPGNVRELENWIARIVVFGTEEAVRMEFKRHMGTGGGLDVMRRHSLRVNLSRERGARRRG